jgi:rhodanese-related sulfurtransferase
MIDQVRPAALQDWLTAQGTAAGTPGLVLDVREPWELQTASVRPDGFELLVIPMGQLAQRLGELDPERPVAVLCHHGNRSQRVAMFMAQQGFTRLANVAGGIEAWSAEVDPAVPRY